MAYNLASGLSGSLTGATSGAKLGSTVPGLGTTTGAVVGGLIGGLSGFGSKNSSSKKMAQAMALQQYYWEQQMSKAHQLEAEDLKKAGFNPALTAGTASAGAGIGNVHPTYEPEFQDSAHTNQISSGLKMLETVKNYQELKNTEDKTKAEINNIEADTTGKALNNDIVKKYGSKQAKAKLANTLMDTQEKKARIGLNLAMTGNTEQQAISLARENAYWDNHPNLYSYNTGYRNITKDVINGIGSAVGIYTGAKKLGAIGDAISRERVTEKYGKNGQFTGATRSWYK